MTQANKPFVATVEDMRKIAQARVPKMFYDYADSGSWTESTYRANESDFQHIKFRQRVAQNMEGRTIRTTMVGEPCAMPVALAAPLRIGTWKLQCPSASETQVAHG